MKQVMQAIDANGKVQTVYKKIVDLGGGLYADATAVALSGSNALIGTAKTAVFEASTAINTVKEITITKPASVRLAPYKFIISNPSTVSEITVKFYDIIADDALGDSYITSLVVPKGGRYSALVEGVFTDDLKIKVSNNVALEVGEGFTATVRVKEV